MTAKYPMRMHPDGDVIAIRNRPWQPRLTWRGSDGSYLTDAQTEGWAELTPAPKSE